MTLLQRCYLNVNVLNDEVDLGPVTLIFQGDAEKRGEAVWPTFFISVLLLLSACISRESKNISRDWYVVTERSMIPEAGGYHPFLWRKSVRVRVMVDTDTYSVTDLGEDCVAWYGLDSRGLFVACGDHEPLLLQRNPQMQTDIRVSGDTLRFDQFETSVTAAKQAARKQKPLTSAWHASSLR